MAPPGDRPALSDRNDYSKCRSRLIGRLQPAGNLGHLRATGQFRGRKLLHGL